MTKKTLFALMVFAGVLLIVLWSQDKYAKTTPVQIIEKPIVTPAPALPSRVQLQVPYVAEAPEGLWVGPWKNACEEASLAMVRFFYQHKAVASVLEAKTAMTEYFALQDRLWGSNANADAAHLEILANREQDFAARVVTGPSTEDIKTELAGGRPVIALLNGKKLGNKNIPFLASGSYYHVLVVIGYDDVLGEFITHDDGDERTGREHRYKYESFLAALADYDFKTRKADGPARVLFTASK